MSYPEKPPLSERNILLLLATVQFTQIMDFMLMMPLGPQLMREMALTSSQFAGLISSFSIAAGVVGLCAAPYLDRFDRRKVLLICYAGFIVGTFLCGLSHTASQLGWSRAACGAFAGVSGATIMAIVSDIVPRERRAWGMGMIMTAFSVAAALGVPFGLAAAQHFGWQVPFLVIAGVGGVVWFGLFHSLPAVRGHLEDLQGKMVLSFGNLLKNANAWRGIALMMVMVFGHFTVIPFLSPYLVHHVGVPEKHLFLIYLVGGIVTVYTGPKIGKLTDRYGRLCIYMALVIASCFVIRYLTTATPMPLWQVLVLAACFFAFASGRFVPGQATVSMAVPNSQRGAYMSLIACTRDLASGLTAGLAGLIIDTRVDGQVLHYDRLGWIAIGFSLLSIWLLKSIKSVEV